MRDLVFLRLMAGKLGFSLSFYTLLSFTRFSRARNQLVFRPERERERESSASREAMEWQASVFSSG